MKKFLIRCVDRARTTMTAEPLPLEIAEQQALKLEGRGRGVRCEVYSRKVYVRKTRSR